MYERLAVVIAAGLVAAVLVFGLGSVSTQQSIKPSVSVEFGKGYIHVHVSLPGPSYSYSYGYSYLYNYSYSYGYTPMPVTVIVFVEKLVTVQGTTVAEPAGLGGVYNLEAYGPNHELDVGFNVAPGQYRVKVMFWNNLLPVLKAAHEPWKSLAKPYVEEGTVSAP